MTRTKTLLTTMALIAVIAIFSPLNANAISPFEAIGNLEQEILNAINILVSTVNIAEQDIDTLENLIAIENFYTKTSSLPVPPGGPDIYMISIDCNVGDIAISGSAEVHTHYQGTHQATVIIENGSGTLDRLSVGIINPTSTTKTIPLQVLCASIGP